MAGSKNETVVKEKMALLYDGGNMRKVKARQYYSIYDFCRGMGESESLSDEIARWCDKKAKSGEFFKGNGYRIKIVEQEVPARV